MEYKKIYTPEELDDLTQWITEKMPLMPESLQVDEATYIADLKTTAGYYLEIIELHRENRTYGGQIRLLFKVRERLQEIWGM